MRAISIVTWIVVPMDQSEMKVEEPMKMREFTLILTSVPGEKEADELYGIFDDGTISTIAGIPQIHFHREAGSLETAIRAAIHDVRSAGFDVERVELQPDTILLPN
jgi:hypothetical protein